MIKLNLKVRINKNNGQPSINLPKRMFNKVPDNIQINIPKEYMKEVMQPQKKPLKYLWVNKNE